MNSHTALLVIDMQVGIADEAYDEDRAILTCIAGLLAQAREQGTPVIFIQHDGEPGDSLEPYAAGWPIHAMIAPREGETVIRKRASDSFYETPLHETLQARGIQRLIVTGAATQFCVDATCRRAASLNYDVVLVADGHLAADNNILKAAQVVAHHNVTLAHMAHPTHPIQVVAAKDVEF
jgi:nicotinamidase-related amidase